MEKKIIFFCIIYFVSKKSEVYPNILGSTSLFLRYRFLFVYSLIFFDVNLLLSFVAFTTSNHYDIHSGSNHLLPGNWLFSYFPHHIPM